MRYLWFYGTDSATGSRIRRYGFPADSVFYAHLEDAIELGGRHVFEVALAVPKTEGNPFFQFVAEVPKTEIVSYVVYRRECRYEQRSLRISIRRSHLNDAFKELPTRESDA